MTVDLAGARSTPSGIRLDLRVIPRSPRTEVGGWRDGRLVVRVTAPPVDDAANRAVIEAIADAFGVAKRAVRIVAGTTSRNKSIEIDGVSRDHSILRA